MNEPMLNVSSEYQASGQDYLIQGQITLERMSEIVWNETVICSSYYGLNPTWSYEYAE